MTTSFEGVRGYNPPPTRRATRRRAGSRDRPPALTRISSTMLAAHHERSRRVGTSALASSPPSRLPRGALRRVGSPPQRTRGRGDRRGERARARRAVPLRATASSSRADGDARSIASPARSIQSRSWKITSSAADAEPPPRGGARRAPRGSPRPRSASRSSSPPSPRL